MSSRQVKAQLLSHTRPTFSRSSRSPRALPSRRPSAFSFLSALAACSDTTFSFYSYSNLLSSCATSKNFESRSRWGLMGSNSTAWPSGVSRSDILRQLPDFLIFRVPRFLITMERFIFLPPGRTQRRAQGAFLGWGSGSTPVSSELECGGRGLRQDFSYCWVSVWGTCLKFWMEEANWLGRL